MVLIVKFSITGSLRFLSHAETLRSFHRACVRAELPLQYSHGFNPHPKISLPCPRSVGIEALNEILIIQLNQQKILDSQKRFILKIKNALSQQLLEGCNLISVDGIDKKSSFHPHQVFYLIRIGKQYFTDSFRSGIKILLESEHLPFRRYINKKYHKYKDLDLRPFLESIDLNVNDFLDINIVCRITPEGSIRVDEIMNLLNIDMENLVAPICRTNIKWN
ncbi:MAG: TIGR03936 family radical SAM-associated protein [Planctomycetota bacterium]|jgi:radical SAM-linked protein